MSDNAAADNIAEIARENTRSRYIYSGIKAYVATGVQARQRDGISGDGPRDRQVNMLTQWRKQADGVVNNAVGLRD